jgi:signal transduction histidine kinase
MQALPPVHCFAAIMGGPPSPKQVGENAIGRNAQSSDGVRMKRAKGWLIAGSCASGALALGAIAAAWMGADAVAGALIAGMVLHFVLFQMGFQRQIFRLSSQVVEAADKRREQEKHLDRAAMLAFIDALPHAVARLAPDGKIEMANARAAGFGLEPGKDLGTCEPWLRSLVKNAVETRDRATPDEGKGFVQRFEEGRESFYLPAAIPLLNGSGNVDGVAVVLMDVTATRHAHETRKDFMSSFSHELKTPMTSLQMSIYLLLDDAADRLTPRQLDLLKSAREDADRLHRLMEEVLAAARGKQNP